MAGCSRLSGWSTPLLEVPGKLEVLVLGRVELLDRDQGEIIGLGS